MFCNQCEEAARGSLLAQALGMYWGTCDSYARGTGCVRIGVCGKRAETAALQDLLLHAVKGLSICAAEGRRVGVEDREVNEEICRALSSTVASANLDPSRIVDALGRCATLRTRLAEVVAGAGGILRLSGDATSEVPPVDLSTLVEQGRAAGVVSDREASEDVQSLQQVLVYGVQGVAAFADQARALGVADEPVHASLQDAMAALADRTLGVDEWMALVSHCGEAGLRAMALLETAHTDSFGHPTPTEVSLGHVEGKCILVSGHDLKCLADLLRQTEHADIDVYTHGEMLTAHGYPELKKFRRLRGHFGAAWRAQKTDFARFPGAILVNAGCLQEPQQAYAKNIFTSCASGWPGVPHLPDGEFGPLVARAESLPGFPSGEEGGSVTVGFGRRAMLGMADELTHALESGSVRHLFLVGGCDGTKARRNYYADFVASAPQDTVVLALGCGKFRFFERDLGRIGRVPRLLDLGQCNDAWAAFGFLATLARGLRCEVEDLPLSAVISWYGQRSLALLLALIHLRVRSVRLGPSLPVFMSPGVLDMLAAKCGVRLITTADEDMAALLRRDVA